MVSRVLLLLSFLNFVPVSIEVTTDLQSSIPNLFSADERNTCWLIVSNLSFRFCITHIQRILCTSPLSSILKHSPNLFFSNCSMLVSFKAISRSSTYTAMMRIFLIILYESFLVDTGISIVLHVPKFHQWSCSSSV